MKRKILILAFIFWGIGCFVGGYLAKANAFMLVTSTTLYVIDWGQTLDMVRQPTKFRETTNFILDEHPLNGLVVQTIVPMVTPKKYLKNIAGYDGLFDCEGGRKITMPEEILILDPVQSRELVNLLRRLF